MLLKLKRATIKEVARDAGVSTQTVSRVINNRPDVSPETRSRVQQVIEELGYQPSALARSLIQRRSYTLGVVTAGLKYVGPSRTLNGILQKAEQLGYALLLKELPQCDTDNIQPLLQSFYARHVDGILWAVPEVGQNHAWLDGSIGEIATPIVFLDVPPRQGIATLSIDNYAGARLATQHLIQKNHRNIAHISGPLEWWGARERLRGWQDAMKEADLKPEITVEGNWSSGSGEEAANQLLDAHPGIEAVFAANDQMALSVLLVAHRRNVRIPEDLALVGFDDLAESAFFYPPLTTIRQDQFTLGSNGVSMLVDMITSAREEKNAPLQANVIPPELIIRSTT